MFRLLFRLALLVCPRSYRHVYGAEMAEVFAHCLDVERRRHPRLWRMRAWTAIFETVTLGLSLRRDAAVGRGVIVPEPFPGRRIFVRFQDVRSALRVMRHRPLFAAGVVLMLGLGIGATTAIFSVVDGVLLRALPFQDQDRLVQVWGTVPARNITRASLSEANFWDVLERNRTLEDYGSWHGESYTLTEGDAPPERVNGAFVSVGFFRALRPTPVLGRLFQPGDEASPYADNALVLLSHRLWTRRFGADPAIVGRVIALDSRPRQVIGVLPPGTPWLGAADVFVTMGKRANANRGSWEYSSVGRLKPGVTIDQARADLERVARELAAEYPEPNAGMGMAVAGSSEWIAPEALRRTLLMLLGATSLLMLITCVNVTNLLLAQASARTRDTAVRTALGATRGDLVRERLVESLLFSGIGALVGWGVAFLMLSVFKALDPGGIPRLADVTLDWRAAGFAVLAALLVALATGLVPALRASAGDIVSSLRHAQRGAVGDRHNDRLRQVLVTAEVALSLVLLVGAGLLVRSLFHVLTTDRGFQTEQRLLATVSIPSSYPEPRRVQIVESILSKVEALPVVQSVAAVSGRPLTGGSTGLGIVAADHQDIPDSAVPWATWRIITKDYFKTMGLPLLSGRGFTEQDLIAARPYRVVISKRLADQLWPGENPIGRTALLWKGQGNMPGEVIGVVGNMRERSLENDPTYAVYLPGYGALGTTTLQLVMHTQGEPEAIVPALNDIVRGIDPGLPISGVRTLEDIVTQSVATRRFTMLLLAVFSGLAMILSAAGVYGVLAYTVAQRTAEFGVRLALGASPGQVLRRVFSHGLYPVAAGLVIGVLLALWLSQLMTSLLFGVRPHDPVTYVAVSAGLLLIAMLASYLPARRVLRVDPAVALRMD